MSDLAAWYLALQVTALAAWPLVARALEPLDDRGWAASKFAGLVLLAWLAWLLGLAGGLPFTRVVLVALLAAIAAAAWGWTLRHAGRDLPAWMRSRWRLLLAWEVVLVAGLGAFALLRAHEPAIAGTEKPMDMAFLNGFIAAQRLPTQDTWLSGYGVPYYYFGYLLWAAQAKLSGVGAGVAYNLAAASVPALAALGVAGTAWNALRAGGAPGRWAALAASLAAPLAILAGNLSATLEWLVSRGVLRRDAGAWLGVKGFADGVAPGVWPPEGAWWWRASRVVPTIQPDGINEFPFFSLLLSDLHPHFLALPWETLVLTIVLVHLASRGRTLLSPWTQAAAALTLGTLLIANTWDAAPFLPLATLGAWVAGQGFAWRRRLGLALVAPLGGLAAVAPYAVGYHAPPLGLGLVDQRTPLGSLLVLFGPQLALLAALGGWARHAAGDRIGWAVAAVAGVLGALLAASGEPALGLLVSVLGLLLPWPGILGRFPPQHLFALGVAAFAGAMLLGVEVVFLRDTFGTRMNTVFKFHYNAWLLAGVACGAGIALAAWQVRRARWPLLALAALALAAGLVYPLSAAVTRLRHTPPGGHTLDGLAFLAPDERAAVRWLADQVSGDRPVVVEAVAGQYSPGARMATYSGTVTVLGWVGHELQWRGPLPEYGRRESDVARLYRDGAPEEIPTILNRYGVRFVVVGDLERQQYGTGVDTRFEGVLPLAFRVGRVSIYRAP